MVVKGWFIKVLLIKNFSSGHSFVDHYLISASDNFINYVQSLHHSWHYIFFLLVPLPIILRQIEGDFSLKLEWILFKLFPRLAGLDIFINVKKS